MKNKIEPKWFLFDASGQILGRFSTNLADILRGKNKIDFKNNIVGGPKVVVINCSKIRVSGKKEESKKYYSYSGYHGGLKTQTFGDLRVKDASYIIKHAVKGMLPKTKLQSIYLNNLYLYNDQNHPHTNVKFEQ